MRRTGIFLKGAGAERHYRPAGDWPAQLVGCAQPSWTKKNSVNLLSLMTAALHVIDI
jgi:hypothetical protein